MAGVEVDLAVLHMALLQAGMEVGIAVNRKVVLRLAAVVVLEPFVGPLVARLVNDTRSPDIDTLPAV